MAVDSGIFLYIFYTHKHICLRHWLLLTLVQVMACRLLGAKSLLESMLSHHQLNPLDETFIKYEFKYNTFQENACNNIVCKMSGILFWPQCFHCMRLSALLLLTHCWGRVTHVCVGNLTIIGSDNGLSPDRHQAIIWTNDGIMLIGPLGINFSESLIKIHTFSFTKMHLKISSVKRQPFCPGETS